MKVMNYKIIGLDYDRVEDIPVSFTPEQILNHAKIVQQITQRNPHDAAMYLLDLLIYSGYNFAEKNKNVPSEITQTKLIIDELKNASHEAVDKQSDKATTISESLSQLKTILLSAELSSFFNANKAGYVFSEKTLQEIADLFGSTIAKLYPEASLGSYIPLPGKNNVDDELPDLLKMTDFFGKHYEKSRWGVIASGRQYVPTDFHNKKTHYKSIMEWMINTKVDQMLVTPKVFRKIKQDNILYKIFSHQTATSITSTITYLNRFNEAKDIKARILYKLSKVLIKLFKIKPEANREWQEESEIYLFNDKTKEFSQPFELRGQYVIPPIDRDILISQDHALTEAGRAPCYFLIPLFIEGNFICLPLSKMAETPQKLDDVKMAVYELASFKNQFVTTINEYLERVQTQQALDSATRSLQNLANQLQALESDIKENLPFRTVLHNQLNQYSNMDSTTRHEESMLEKIKSAVADKDWETTLKILENDLPRIRQQVKIQLQDAINYVRATQAEIRNEDTSVDIKPTWLSIMFNKAKEKYEAILKEQDITFELRLLKDTKGRVKDALLPMIDSAVVTIIENFLKNSIEEFTFNHQLLGNRKKKIVVAVTENEKFHIIHWRDTGIGIREDAVENILSGKGKNKSRKGQGGEHGIGVSSTKRKLERRGGKLEIVTRDKEGNSIDGAYFKLYFPKIEELKSAVGEVITKTIQSDNKNIMDQRLKGMKILVADDDNAIAEGYADLYRTSGLEVKIANNGQEALDYIDTGYQPDLIITDVEMPVLNGFGLLDGLKARKFQKPVIVVSGAITTEEGLKDRKKARELGNLGATDILLKPVNFDDLFNKSQAILLKQLP